MVNPPNLKGQYFGYTLTAGGSINSRVNLDRGIKHNEARVVSTHINAQPGQHGGQSWVFSYLKYWAGAITRTKLTMPVLTGPMSGCILCQYNNNGQTSVAHIGTDSSPQTPNTIAVKADWTSYIASKRNPNVMGRRPSDVITQDDVFAEAMKGGGIPSKYEVWGYFTPSDAWALLIHRSDQFGGVTSSKIVLVRPMLLLPWNSIPGHW